MTTWFRETPESRRLLAEERLIVGAIELVSEAAERRGVTRTELSARLGVNLSEISQRLSGRRNLTLRSFASMLDALDFDAELRLRDRNKASRTSVYHDARTSDWPEGHHGYTQKSTPLRLINGGRAA